MGSMFSYWLIVDSVYQNAIHEGKQTNDFWSAQDVDDV